MEGEPLTIIPSIQATWGFWRARYPNTKVMTLPGEDGRPYYYRNRPTGQPSPRKSTKEHDLSVLGFGLAVGDDAFWAPLRELWEHESLRTVSLGGQTIRIFHDADAMTAWAENADGELLSGVLADEEGWLDFFPDSKGLE